MHFGTKSVKSTIFSYSTGRDNPLSKRAPVCIELNIFTSYHEIVQYVLDDI